MQQAHTLARLLLTDVREAVSQLRESGAIDLGAALRPLAENVPKLDIHMDIQHPLTVYGELDISILGEKPRNRLPIITNIVSPNSRAQMYTKVDAEIANGQTAGSVVDAEGEGKDGIFTFEGAAQVREIDIPMVVGND